MIGGCTASLVGVAVTSLDLTLTSSAIRQVGVAETTILQCNVQ